MTGCLYIYVYKKETFIYKKYVSKNHDIFTYIIGRNWEKGMASWKRVLERKEERNDTHCNEKKNGKHMITICYKYD